MARKIVCPHGLASKSCKVCQKAYDHRKYLSNKQTMNEERYRRTKMNRLNFNETVKGSPCTDCGRAFPPWMMDFDHLGAKVSAVAALVSNGKLDEALLEIQACDLVCAVCHGVRTILRRGSNLEVAEFAKMWSSREQVLVPPPK